jgi:UDP-3-O-[3-hydroxymyristoyl] glucosamine N-acyltransferase
VTPLSASEIATRVKGEIVGNPEAVVCGVGSLDDAAENHLAFLGKDTPKYRAKLLPSRAAVVLVPADFDEPVPDGRTWIRCADPSAEFTRFVIAAAPPPPEFPPGIAPSAVIADNATVAASAHIGANAVIEAGASIGANTIVQAGCVIAHAAKVGDRCRLHPNVTLLDHSVLGNGVVVHSGSVIGSDGFGFVQAGGKHEKVPQLGIVQVDDDVEIGANVTIDRARFGRTWIQNNCIIDNLVQIGHNCIVREGTIIVSQVGISGSCIIGKNAILAGQAGLAGHLEIGDGAVIMAKTGVISNVEAGAQVMGTPGVPNREFFRNAAAIRKLPDLIKTVHKLERKLQELSDEDEPPA